MNLVACIYFGTKDIINALEIFRKLRDAAEEHRDYHTVLYAF
jgi:hypothetical protein